MRDTESVPSFLHSVHNYGEESAWSRRSSRSRVRHHAAQKVKPGVLIAIR